jgi:hypothetical protein
MVCSALGDVSLNQCLPNVGSDRRLHPKIDGSLPFLQRKQKLPTAKCTEVSLEYAEDSLQGCMQEKKITNRDVVNCDFC